MQQTFHRALLRAGLPRVAFHDLRHSAATLPLAEGEDLRNIMDLLGHSSIDVTADVYGHVFDASKRRMAGRMDALLGVAQG